MKKGLGRGLSSLFGDYEIEEQNNNNNEQQKVVEKIVEKVVEVPTKDSVIEVEIGLIDNNPNQPRKNFDEKSLKELSQSIKKHGVIQPVLVQKVGERYLIIAGERRYRASRMAGLKTIPVIIKDYTKQELSEVAIIENLQREDLNPIESAKAIQNLITEYNLTQEEVADKIGKSRPAVANTLRLLTLPEEVVNLIEQGKLSAGHAKALLMIEDKSKIIEVAKIVVNKKISVRELESLVKTINKPAKIKEKKEQSLELKDFTNKLNQILATKVSIIGNDKKGRIYIDYYSTDDLQRIYDILNR